VYHLCNGRGAQFGRRPNPPYILQAVVASARTLADISDERVVPVDYLLALIALFLLMVLDRLCYSLGNCAGKARAPPPRPRAALPAPCFVTMDGCTDA